MSKRYVSVWLPHWPTERRRRAQGKPDQTPFALVAPGNGGVRVVAVDAFAASEGLHPGMPLADARALLPGLKVAEADPASDARALGMLADWCTRYTPWTATDGNDGLVLDITGCAHLLGGEPELLADLVKRLRHTSLTARIAIADTPSAAWACSRHGKETIVPPEQSRNVVAALPVAALRLLPEAVERLRGLGLRTIGDILPLPRAPLARRVGMAILERLDRVLGREEEPISPRGATTEWRTRIAFAEPIGRAEDIECATMRLLEELCRRLGRDGRGIRRLELAVYRVDGSTQRLGIGTGKASRDAQHLFRLFTEKLKEADPGYGVETMIVTAAETDCLRADQLDLSESKNTVDADLNRLIDRLQNRLGRNSLVRIAPFDSHIPERAVTVLPAMAPPNDGDWLAEQPRPIRLLPCPEPIEAVAPVPDEPPVRFAWRNIGHRVIEAEGPERIEPEWWRAKEGARFRDYYRIEDEAGRRFWVFRDGPYESDRTPRWYMHGLFA